MLGLSANSQGMLPRAHRAQSMMFTIPEVFVSKYYICNELGKGRPRLETGATDDGLLEYLKQQSGDGII